MALTSDTLRLAEARRIALQAQGFNDPRPTGRVDRRHLRRVLDRVGLVQIDSVNVLTRSHELPFFARLGPVPRAALLPTGCGAAASCSSTGATRPRSCPSSMHPLLRWRMAQAAEHAWRGIAALTAERAGLVAAMLRGGRASGGRSSAGDLSRRTAAQGGAWMWTGTTPRWRSSGCSGSGRGAGRGGGLRFARLLRPARADAAAAILARPRRPTRTPARQLLRAGRAGARGRRRPRYLATTTASTSPSRGRSWPSWSRTGGWSR